MGKEYTLRTVSSDGSVIDETKLVLEEKSILIQAIPNGATASTAHAMHEGLVRALKDDCKVITMHPNVKLQVLEIT